LGGSGAPAGATVSLGTTGCAAAGASAALGGGGAPAGATGSLGGACACWGGVAGASLGSCCWVVPAATSWGRGLGRMGLVVAGAPATALVASGAVVTAGSAAGAAAGAAGAGAPAGVAGVASVPCGVVAVTVAVAVPPLTVAVTVTVPVPLAVAVAEAGSSAIFFGGGLPVLRGEASSAVGLAAASAFGGSAAFFSSGQGSVLQRIEAKPSCAPSAFSLLRPCSHVYTDTQRAGELSRVRPWFLNGAQGQGGHDRCPMPQIQLKTAT
jgi:hypothetical protein